MAERGLAAEIRALIAQDDVPGEGGEQLGLELFEDFTSPVARQLEARGVQPAARGPGRPEGSKTRSNLNIVRLLKATRRPTLLALKEWSELSLDDFGRATGITDPKERWDAWFKIAQLVTAYEEGTPVQRVELDGKGAVMPIAIFGDLPVRPDLAEGNPPDDAETIDITDWTVRDADLSANDMSEA